MGICEKSSKIQVGIFGTYFFTRFLISLMSGSLRSASATSSWARTSFAGISGFARRICSAFSRSSCLSSSSGRPRFFFGAPISSGVMGSAAGSGFSFGSETGALGVLSFRATISSGAVAGGSASSSAGAGEGGAAGWADSSSAAAGEVSAGAPTGAGVEAGALSAGTVGFVGLRFGA